MAIYIYIWPCVILLGVCDGERPGRYPDNLCRHPMPTGLWPDTRTTNW